MTRAVSPPLLAAGLVLSLGLAAACIGSADTTGPALPDPAPEGPLSPGPGPDATPPLDRAAVLAFWNAVLRDQALDGLPAGRPGTGAALAPAACETECDPETGDCHVVCSAEVERACTLGGRITTSRELEGFRDPEAGDFALAFSSRTGIEACRETIDERVVTFQGAPELTCDGALAFEGGQPAGTWTFRSSGAVSFATEDGETGNCVIDVDWSFDADTGVVTEAVDDSYCCPDPDEPACAEG